MGCGCSCQVSRRRASDAQQETGTTGDGLPAVGPPTKRKAAMFKEERFTDIDKRANKVPKRYLKKNFAKLVKYLTKDVDSELGKLRALFVWATGVDIRKVVSQESAEAAEGSPLEFLQKIHWNLNNHAHLFAQLCSHADIPCVTVTGVNKNASYRPGCHLNQPSLRAQWNAVYVEGDWRLLDVLWSSACLKKEQYSEWVLVNIEQMDRDEDEEEDEEVQHVRNEFFFLTDPDMMVCTHFPDDPQWQLLPRPVAMKKFASYVYVRERFFQLGLGMSQQSKTHCVLRTIRGVVNLGFSIPEDKSSNISFKFLFYSLKNDGRSSTNFTLDHYVLYEKSLDNLHYTIRFPRAGCFRMDLFGQDQSTHRHQDLVCSYVIECDEGQPSCQPLPDSPEVGWGVTCEASDLGIQPLTHDRAIICTETGVCELRFKLEEELSMSFSIKANDQEEFLLRQCAVMWREQDVVIFQARFTEPGEYAFKLYANNGDSKGNTNVCNYLIQVQGSEGSHTSFPVMRGGIIGRSSIGAYYQVQPLSHKHGLVRVNEKHLQIKMSSDENVELVAEITNNDIDTKTLMSRATCLQSTGETTFVLDLPKYGEYAVNIFAREISNPRNIHHTYTYLVQCEPTEEETGDEEMLFEPPPLLIPTSVCTAKSELITTYSRRTNAVVANLVQRGEARDKPKARVKEANNQNSGRKSTKDEVLRLSLKDCAEYELLLFEEISGLLQVFGSVEVQREENVREEIGNLRVDISDAEKQMLKKSKSKEAQQRVYRRQLRVAIQTKNMVLLKQTLEELDALELEGMDADIAKARESLALLRMADKLSSAMVKRDIEALEQRLEEVRNSEFKLQLEAQTMAAERLLLYLKRLERLRKLDRMRQDILSLDSMTFAEIRSYKNPPVPVHLVLMATCILLGEDESAMQDWHAVQQLISKSGKDALQRRVFEFAADTLDIYVALRAKILLSSLLLDDVIVVSAGAATFFVWANGVIEEAEEKFLQSGGDLEAVTNESANSKTMRKVAQIFESYFSSKNKFHGITQKAVTQFRKPSTTLAPGSPSSDVDSARKASKIERMGQIWEQASPRNTPPSTRSSNKS